MDNNMKKRWISLYVENQVGKCYNLDSLTVGTTEDPTVSRMTIATVSDDETFEQIKKQLNRMIEVIKVIDFTDVFVRMKEILYVKVLKCTPEDKVEIFQIAETFKAKVIDYGKDSLLVEFVQTAPIVGPQHHIIAGGGKAPGPAAHLDEQRHRISQVVLALGIVIF